MSDARRSPRSPFLASLASIALIGPLAIHLFMPVMPHVQKAFDMPAALVGASFSITLVVVALATLLCGSLSDRFGRRPVLLGGLVLFAVGTIACSLAGSAFTLIAGRIVQALGAGAAASLNRAIAHDAYGPDRLVKVLAYLTMAYTLGPMLAPVIGGFLIDHLGWRSTFWFAFTAGAAILIAAWGVLYETHHARASSLRIGDLLRTYAALVRQPRFTAFVMQSGFSTGTFLAMATAASFLMQDYLGRPAREFGFYFLLFPGGLFLGNLIASRLSGRVAIETMVLAGSVLCMTAIAVQSVLILSGLLVPLVIFLPGFVMTFAQGLAYPNAQTGAMRAMPAAAGSAAGLGVCFQMALGALGAQTYALLADGTPHPMVTTVLGGAVLTLLAGIVPFAMRRRGH